MVVAFCCLWMNESKMSLVTYVHKCSQILTKIHPADTAAQDFLVKYDHGHI